MSKSFKHKVAEIWRRDEDCDEFNWESSSHEAGGGREVPDLWGEIRCADRFRFGAAIDGVSLIENAS